PLPPFPRLSLRSTPSTPWAATLLAAVAGLYGILHTFGRTTLSVRDTYPGYVLTSRSLVPPSRWIRDHLPPGTTLATRRIGALGYYSRHPVFDYCFGLTDRDVARLIHRRGGRRFDHPDDPGLAPLWRRRAPDYLLEDDDLTHALTTLTGPTADTFELHGIRYHVLRRFPIARATSWVLAERQPPPR
nr:hypothetical protein [Acidobacteriota bacterium]